MNSNKKFNLRTTAIIGRELSGILQQHCFVPITTAAAASVWPIQSETSKHWPRLGFVGVPKLCWQSIPGILIAARNVYRPSCREADPRRTIYRLSWKHNCCLVLDSPFSGMACDAQPPKARDFESIDQSGSPSESPEVKQQDNNDVERAFMSGSLPHRGWVGSQKWLGSHMVAQMLASWDNALHAGGKCHWATLYLIIKGFTVHLNRRSDSPALNKP